MTVTRRIALAAGAALALAAPAAFAQAFPGKPLKLVVNFPPGGAADVIGRALAQQLGEQLRQQVVVENKPGANGNIGADAVAKSAADGHTLLMSSGGAVTVNPFLYTKMPFDAEKDLVPVASVARVLVYLMTNPSVPVNTAQEFVTYAKANPGKLNCSSTGIGTSSHLSCFILAKRAGFEAVHVPYKGADALRDLLAGRVQFMFATIPSVKQHIDAGALRAVAVTSLKRSRSMPEVPTVAERGFPGFEAGSWFGFFGPKGTPAEVVATLNKAVNEIIAVPAMEAQLIKEGADPAGGTPQQFAQFVQREFEKWRVVVKESGATAE